MSGHHGRASSTSKIERIWKRAGGVCWLCDGLVTLAEASIDHADPVTLGGSRGISNQRCAHKACNNAKGALPHDVTVAVLGEARRLAWPEPLTQAEVIVVLSKAAKPYNRAVTLRQQQRATMVASTRRLPDIPPLQPRTFREQTVIPSRGNAKRLVRDSRPEQSG